MKPFFNAKDFHKNFLQLLLGDSYAITCVEAAEVANQLLLERGTVVRGGMNAAGAHGYFGFDPFPVMPNTHQALLINIEPIEKDSAESLLREFLDPRGYDHLMNLKERAKKLLEGK